MYLHKFWLRYGIANQLYEFITGLLDLVFVLTLCCGIF